MVKHIEKQFLLNPDGSYPEGTNIELLANLGYRFVVPTPAPQIPGEISIEEEPELLDGVWYQRWSSRLPVPEDNLAVAQPTDNSLTVALESLSEEQKMALKQALGL